MVLGSALKSQTWFNLCFIGSEHRLTQHSLLLLSPRHASPCPSLDLLVMESLGEWDHFTNLNKGNKEKDKHFQAQYPDSSSCSQGITEQPGGGVEGDLPCQGQLQSDQTQPYSAPRLQLMYTSTDRSKHRCQSRPGLGAFPAALSCCSDIHTELG